MRRGLNGRDVDAKHLIDVSMHDTKVFPALPSIDCVLTAHETPDSFSAWAEIVDTTGTPIALSSVFASYEGHITSMAVESMSVASEIYIVKLSYGASKVAICEFRMEAGSTLQPVTQVPRIRGAHIPKGETVYYQMSAETGSATMNVSFRYFVES